VSRQRSRSLSLSELKTRSSLHFRIPEFVVGCVDWSVGSSWHRGREDRRPPCFEWRRSDDNSYNRENTRPIEDPLAYLPCSNILEYGKHETIYSQERPSAGIYLIIDGNVKVCRTAGDRRQVVVDIYQPDDFFGESALLGAPEGNEMAVSLERTHVMSWTMPETEDIATRRPKLAIALLQLLVQRSIEFGGRIESFSTDNVPRRLARSLVRFSERLGTETEDGMVQLIPFTHELLSQYVGTSREIVTQFMDRFRREGYLSYSRKGIMIRKDALNDWLHHAAVVA
jgi:CRP/FNR family cyclic AMP-dependent transcriptional regulator